MFLDVTIRRNPALIQTAIELHQVGEIPPNTYLIDLDTVVQNVRTLVETAQAHNLKLYGMTKQQGRNPLLARVMVAAGLPQAVAVDFDGARVLHAYGIPLGNVGHLTQVPDRAIPEAVRMRPEVITVFSVEKAKRIGTIAQQAGVVQPILLRVVGEPSAFYPAQEGGFSLEQLMAAAKEINQIKGVALTGVTTFPCLKFDYDQGQVLPTANLEGLCTAAEMLRETFGAEVVKQINGPGVSTSSVMAMLAKVGVTHLEPGSSMTGHTPIHAIQDEPERPAMVYVSEVSHRLGDRIFVFGGGFYPRGRTKAAIVARSPELALETQPLSYQSLPGEAIDYYGELRGAVDDGHKVGDSVVFAFRSQIFVSRASVAVVSGLQHGEGQLLGLFNRVGQMLDPVHKMPLGLDGALERVEQALSDIQQQN